MSTYIIACGGTGGHLSPGIALAERLTKDGHDCVLLISSKQVDARYVKQYKNFQFLVVPGGAKQAGVIGLFRFIWGQLRSLVFGLGLLRRFRPAAVIAFGGFVTLGIGISALLMRCPLALHEANRVPGKAVRMLGRYARRVYLPEGVSMEKVAPGIVKPMAYPLRSEMKRISKGQARETLGLERVGKLLLVLGGSQGARVLNEWVTNHFEALALSGISVYCITGVGNIEPGCFERTSNNGENAQLTFVPFSDQMNLVLSSADLVVARAGAGSIAEILECRVPSILVPYPYAADQHQVANARQVVEKKVGILMEESEIEELYDKVTEILLDDACLKSFENAFSSSGIDNCVDAFAEDIYSLTDNASEGKTELVADKTTREMCV